MYLRKRVEDEKQHDYQRHQAHQMPASPQPKRLV